MQLRIVNYKKVDTLDKRYDKTVFTIQKTLLIPEGKCFCHVTVTLSSKGKKERKKRTTNRNKKISTNT